MWYNSSNPFILLMNHAGVLQLSIAIDKNTFIKN